VRQTWVARHANRPSVTEQRLRKAGRSTRVKTEGYSYDLPEKGMAERGLAVLDTAVAIAEFPRAQASLDALWCAAKHLPHTLVMCRELGYC
jgi:hypothetical protein